MVKYDGNHAHSQLALARAGPRYSLTQARLSGSINDRVSKATTQYTGLTVMLSMNEARS